MWSVRLSGALVPVLDIFLHFVSSFFPRVLTEDGPSQRLRWAARFELLDPPARSGPDSPPQGPDEKCELGGKPRDI